jgi:hypothetical protein
LIVKVAILVSSLLATGSTYVDSVVEEDPVVYFSPSLYAEEIVLPPRPPDYSVCGTDRVDDIFDIAFYASNAGFVYDDLVVSVSVALAESAGDPEARARNRNGSTDSGLWQVNSVHGFSGLKDPQTNADAAFQVWQQQGWTAWYAHTPRGGEYGSGPRFVYWYPIVHCLLTLSPEYDTIVLHNDTGE